VGLTIRGYYQGFLKGSSALLTPAVALWLCLRYAHKLSLRFAAATGSASASLVLVILVILVVSFIGIRIIRNLVRRLFDRLRMRDLDKFLGGALGLFQATAIVWVVIAFAFIVYPKGRPAIQRSWISSEILSLGDDVPFLRQKLSQADRYVKSTGNPLDQFRPAAPPESVNALANPKALDDIDFGDDSLWWSSADPSADSLLTLAHRCCNIAAQ
jgi:uncharacterized membrane protein required for colicin V production